MKGAGNIEMARAGSDWKLVKPVEARSDYSAIEGFMTRLSSANMSRIIEENPADLARYGLDKPSMTVTVGVESAKAVLQIGKTENDQTYAKDASRPIVFTVDSTLQTDLNKSFDDYRKKELFEFRPFSLAKIRAVLDAPGGAKTYELEKAPAATPGGAETWKVTRVGGASHTPDAAAMDDLLNKLVAIKAESFVAGSTKTGVDKPALVVSVSYDDGKFERVRFGAVGDNAYGVRDGEAGVAKVDANSMKAAMSAFDLVTIPPAPPEKKLKRKSNATWIAVLMAVTGLAQQPLPAQTIAPATVPSPTEQLRRDLQAIFTEPAIDHGTWSVNVTSLRDGETLYRSNAFRLQTPASNQKLLTAAAAAERLGWDYRYTTRIYATGPIDSNGHVNGDLVVVSNGDPTINPRHPDRWGQFEEWAKLLAAKGIRQVDGYLIGDDNAFEEPGWSPGWSWDDLALGYGAAATALQYHENQVELMVNPGQQAGARAVIIVSPSGSGLTIDHQVTTAAAGEPNRLNLLRGAGQHRADGDRPGGARRALDHASTPPSTTPPACTSTRCARPSCARVSGWNGRRSTSTKCRDPST